MTAEAPDDSVRVARVRFADGKADLEEDSVAIEEPLEIQLGGASLAVLMRTPGHDADLALGFLVTERVVDSPAQVVSVRHCRAVSDPDAAENVIRVVLAPGVAVDLDALRRNLYASSSCGICGKATIANALASAPPLADESRFETAFFPPLPERLQAAQPTFARTGGLHAAGLFAPDGALLVVREDVGRHNAVDKVIGWALREGRLPLAGHVLLVSGRISYELVQKALVARIPVLAAVSAPSSLAVDLAQRARLTLVGFLRGASFNVYGERSRVVARG
ncbi:MAG TPA: formate dehydrogenase accessory sulfurtransferase FdhD [Myxococcota bacterium]